MYVKFWPETSVRSFGFTRKVGQRGCEYLSASKIVCMVSAAKSPRLLSSHSHPRFGSHSCKSGDLAIVVDSNSSNFYLTQNPP
jgi:hypothetical protein